jgi:hypothetical protein
MGLETLYSHLHHPYTKPYLAFLIEDQNTSTGFNPEGMTEENVPRQSIGWISIDEFGPHTINPIFSLALILPIQIILTVSAMFIQIRTLQMLKREKSVNNRLMVTQAKIHIIFWPSIIVINTLTDNIYPLSALTTPMFCSFLSFYFYFCVFSMILYSLYAAILRYLCCLRSEWVNDFGKSRLIAIFYWIFYLHTFLWSLYNVLTSFNLDHLPLINSCYGYNDRIFLLEETRWNVVKRHFCALHYERGKDL